MSRTCSTHGNMSSTYTMLVE